jgi:hypothetical protein
MQFPPYLEIMQTFGFFQCTSLMEVIVEPGSVVKAIKGFQGWESLSRITLPLSLRTLQSVDWIALTKHLIRIGEEIQNQRR